MRLGQWITAGAWAVTAALAQAAGDETVAVRGLGAPAEILVDRWGVPHIRAASADDVFFVQGWNAARDRLFQIDLWRRRGLGQLAEVLGPGYVEQDRAARLFLYRGSLEREWAAYGPDSRRITRRFVAGLNAYVDWLAANPQRLPREFALLGYKPAKWAPEDVVRIRSHGLTRNLTREVARARLACLGGLARNEIYYGLQPQWQTRIPDGLDPCLPADVLKVFNLATQNPRITTQSIRRAAAPGDENAGELTAAESAASEGSNNWVIAPSRSTTGRPILANDPHRAYSTPSLRYIVHLSAPGMDVIGAGEPALPGISIGHNGTIGFGLTIFSIDQEDLYVYELDPADPGRYRYRGRFEPMRLVRETVKVAGGPAHQVELPFTRHGPVIHVDREKGRAYAVRTAWSEPGMSPYFGSIRYMFARDWPQFLRAMRDWGAPTENQVYADVKGNIGWVPGGLAPRRLNWDGLLPVPGDGRYEWSGFISGGLLPRLYNPREGWLASANQMNLPEDFPIDRLRLSFEWTNDSRYTRIARVLGGTGKVSLEDSMRLQNDHVSMPAVRLAPLLARLSSDDPAARAALALLNGWDHDERADSAAAALFEVWVSRHLLPGFRDRILTKPEAEAIPVPDIHTVLQYLEVPAGRFGGDDVVERDRLLVRTLATAWAEAERLLGRDSSGWQWGRLHHNLPEHPLAAAVDAGVRDELNAGRYAKSGGPYVPNQSTYRQGDFRQTNGPSFRMVLDVGNWDNSRAVNHPGQAGDPASPHYRDLAPMWQKGEYFPLLYSRRAVDAAVEQRIRLRPLR